MILRARDRSRGPQLRQGLGEGGPDSGALLCATASSRPAASSGEPPGLINSSNCRETELFRRSQLDELPRGVQAGRLRELVVLDRRQKRAGDLCAQDVERLVAPEAGQPHQLRARGRRQLDRQPLERASPA